MTIVCTKSGHVTDSQIPDCSNNKKEKKNALRPALFPIVSPKNQNNNNNRLQNCPLNGNTCSTP